MRAGFFAIMITTATAAHAAVTAVDPLPTGVDLEGVFGLGHDVFIVGGAGTILETGDGGATWKRLPTHTTADLHGIWGLGKELYAVGDGGLVLHSPDAGATWTAATAPVSAALMAVWGPAPDDITAVGTDGAIVHSVDHGATWTVPQLRLSNGDHATLRAIAGASAKTVIAVGDGGTIVTRRSGTWQAEIAAGETLRSIIVAGAELHGVGFGGRSTRFDAEWGYAHEQPSTSRNLRGVWRTGTTLVAIGEAVRIRHGDSSQATILRSTDDGKTWTDVANDFYFRLSAVWGDATALWVVGDFGEIGRSTDGGKTWKRLDKRVGWVFPVRSIVSASNEIFAGEPDSLVSTDAGVTWTRFSQGCGLLARIDAGVVELCQGARLFHGNGQLNKQQVPEIDPRAVAGAGTTLVEVGAAGKVLISADGGTTWTLAPIPEQKDLAAAWQSGSVFYVGGERGALYRSDRGGAWQAMHVSKRVDQFDIVAGYADGKDLAVVARDHVSQRASLLISHDTGATWTATTSLERDAPAMVGGLGRVVVVAGEHGGVARSPDFGATWTRAAIDTNHLATAVWTDGKVTLVGSDHGELWRITP